MKREQWLEEIKARGGKNRETEEVLDVKWQSTLPGGADDARLAVETIEKKQTGLEGFPGAIGARRLAGRIRQL